MSEAGEAGEAGEEAGGGGPHPGVPVAGGADPGGAHPGVPDLLGPDLRVLFCGINPGLVSAAKAQHFARPGNRFWKVLHLAGFTPALLGPDDQEALPGLGIGITNLVARPSAAASELQRAELREGAGRLAAMAAVVRPAHVAVLGALAYRSAFARPAATVGPQPDDLGGARLWVLPNPSGLQASYQLPEMVELYGRLAAAAGYPAAGP
ncbi:MAG TPA: G/U mismatch-specific DNA glycosylase [Acidimicrobiales bacterium]|nr:G/U mismatch-specific DNA glycosylase [Acidimicrobiales bacterium]